MAVLIIEIIKGLLWIKLTKDGFIIKPPVKDRAMVGSIFFARINFKKPLVLLCIFL